MPTDQIGAADTVRAQWVRTALGATALMAIVPFLLPVQRPPIQSFYQEWVAFALGSVAFVALGIALRGRRIEVPRVAVIPLGLGLILTLQVAAQKLPYWQQAVLGGLYLLWAAAIAVLGYGLRRSLGWTGFAKPLSWVIVAGALATGMAAAAQLVGWGDNGWVLPLASRRLYGNLGQPNHFADYVSLGLMSVVYLAASGRMPRLPAAVIAGFFLLVLTFSGSRAVWIYLTAAVVLGWHLRVRAQDPQARAVAGWTVGLIAAMVLLQLIVHLISPQWGGINETVGTRVFEEGTGVASRLRHGQAAWMMLQSAPLLGVGFEAYGWNHFLLAAQLPPQHDIGVADHAHNIVLQVVAEFGLLGAIVGLAGGCFWLAAQRAASFDLERWWVYALLATLLAHSLLEYPLWYAYFLGVFALFLGASDGHAWRFSSAPLGRIAFAGVVAVAVWTLASVLFDYRRLEEVARLRNESAEQVEQIRATVLALHRTSLLAPLVEFGLSRSIRLEPDGLPDKIAVNGRAMRYLPTADTVFRQSALLALAGDLDEAYRIWDLGAAAYPTQTDASGERLQEIALRNQPGLDALVKYATSR
jgi:O-antigen ligase